MRQSIVKLALSVIAVGAITQYRAVEFGGAQAATAAEKILGIADFPAADGDTLTVNVSGTVLVEAGGAFNPGDPLTVDASGRAVKASALGVATGATAVTSSAANGAILTGGDAPVFVFADALEAAAAAGTIVEVLTRR